MHLGFLARAKISYHWPMNFSAKNFLMRLEDRELIEAFG